MFGLENINNFFALFQRPDFWMRVGIGFSGLGLIILGVIMFILTDKQLTGAVTKVGRVAASKTPVGAGVNVAAEAIG